MVKPTAIDLAEGDAMALVKVRPTYPPQAQRKGIEGYCTVEYTVTSLGTVINPVVIQDQCTSSYFQSASLKAALKFKYKPRVIEGQAIDATVKNRFVFTLEAN